MTVPNDYAVGEPCLLCCASFSERTFSAMTSAEIFEIIERGRISQFQVTYIQICWHDLRKASYSSSSAIYNITSFTLFAYIENNVRGCGIGLLSLNKRSNLRASVRDSSLVSLLPMILRSWQLQSVVLICRLLRWLGVQLQTVLHTFRKYLNNSIFVLIIFTQEAPRTLCISLCLKVREYSIAH